MANTVRVSNAEEVTQSQYLDLVEWRVKLLIEKEEEATVRSLVWAFVEEPGWDPVASDLLLEAIPYHLVRGVERVSSQLLDLRQGWPAKPRRSPRARAAYEESCLEDWLVSLELSVSEGWGEEIPVGDLGRDLSKSTPETDRPPPAQDPDATRGPPGFFGHWV